MYDASQECTNILMKNMLQVSIAIFGKRKLISKIGLNHFAVLVKYNKTSLLILKLETNNIWSTRTMVQTLTNTCMCWTERRKKTKLLYNSTTLMVIASFIPTHFFNLQVIVNAANIAKYECQSYFQNSRWNCSVKRGSEILYGNLDDNGLFFFFV